MEHHLDLTKWFQKKIILPQVDVSEGDDAFGVGEHGGGDDEVSQGVGNDSVLNLEDLLGDSDDDLF